MGEASLWMVGLSILLFWLPTIGPLIAGFVGGRKAGGVRGALITAILPAIIVAALAFLIGTAFELPIIGALIGAGALIVLIVQSVPLIIGAAIGGATIERSAGL
jgi:hypothetical protein